MSECDGKNGQVGGDDVVGKLVSFQETGEGFDGLWIDLHPIVAEFSRRNLRKLGVRLGARNDEGPVAEVVNETFITLCRLSNPAAGGRFDPAKTTPGLSGLRGWLWRVVRSQASNWGRASRGGRSLKTRKSIKVLPARCLEREEARARRPDLLPILEACISRVADPGLQEVVRLKLDEELSERLSAKRLHASVTMVHRRLQKAYALIRPMLEEHGVDGSWLAA